MRFVTSRRGGVPETGQYRIGQGVYRAKSPSLTSEKWLRIWSRQAQVAELVDALVSGTSGESRGGSSPLLGTKRFLTMSHINALCPVVTGKSVAFCWRSLEWGRRLGGRAYSRRRPKSASCQLPTMIGAIEHGPSHQMMTVGEGCGLQDFLDRLRRQRQVRRAGDGRPPRHRRAGRGQRVAFFRRGNSWRLVHLVL